MRTWSQDGRQVRLHSALAFDHTLAILLVVCNQSLEIQKQWHGGHIGGINKGS